LKRDKNTGHSNSSFSQVLAGRRVALFQLQSDDDPRHAVVGQPAAKTETRTSWYGGEKAGEVENGVQFGQAQKGVVETAGRCKGGGAKQLNDVPLLEGKKDRGKIKSAVNCRRGEGGGAGQNQLTGRVITGRKPVWGRERSQTSRERCTNNKAQKGREKEGEGCEGKIHEMKILLWANQEKKMKDLPFQGRTRLMKM